MRSNTAAETRNRLLWRSILLLDSILWLLDDLSIFTCDHVQRLKLGVIWVFVPDTCSAAVATPLTSLTRSQLRYCCGFDLVYWCACGTLQFLSSQRAVWSTSNQLQRRLVRRWEVAQHQQQNCREQHDRDTTQEHKLAAPLSPSSQVAPQNDRLAQPAALAARRLLHRRRVALIVCALGRRKYLLVQVSVRIRPATHSGPFALMLTEIFLPWACWKRC